MRSVASERMRSGRVGLGMLVALAVTACATGSGQVSPDEIPALRQSLENRPNQPEVRLRYAAALFANGDCVGAKEAARAGMAGAPRNAAGPLVLGQCLEQEGALAEAAAVYTTYLQSATDEEGVEAVRTRELLAIRALAEERARLALADEANLANPDPTTTGVLPFDAGGSEELDALRLGVSWMVSTDLAMIQRFRMVERIQMDALLDEMALSEQGLIDPQTAIRAGRLIGAGRLVQGVLSGQRDADAALTASVLTADGEVLRADQQTAPFGELLSMQKALVFDLAAQMGYTLTESERQLILENGTENLIAFLSFSDGLLAEDRGLYGLAAQHYGEAARQDPGFTEAQRRLEAADGADESETAGPTDFTQIASILEPGAPGGFNPLGSVPGNALISSIGDIGSLQGETATGSGTGDGEKQIEQLTLPITVPPGSLPATIRIQIRIPGGL